MHQTISHCRRVWPALHLILACALIGTHPTQASGGTDYDLGVAEFNAKHYLNCINRMRSHLNRFPKDANAYYFAGLSYHYLGDYADAIKMYQTVLTLAPGSKLATKAQEGITSLTATGRGSTGRESGQHGIQSIGNSIKHSNASKCGLPLEVETTHFSIFTNNISEAEYTGAFLECFIKYVDTSFVRIPSRFHRDVVLFDTKETFQKYETTVLKHEAGTGLYEPDTNTFYTSCEGGTGTYAHEMMHAVFHAADVHLEPWAVEGIPEIFEKIFGYCDGQSQEFLIGYPNPWRVKLEGSDIVNLDLEQIVKRESYDMTKYHNSEQREAGMFLLSQGRVRRYIELCMSGDRNGYSTYFEAACQQPFATLLPQWRAYLQNVLKESATIQQIPSSAFFRSKPDFQAFLTGQGRILKHFR